MNTTETISKALSREDIFTWLERGRQIKKRRQQEVEEWFAERMRRQKTAAETGYYDTELRTLDSSSCSENYPELTFLSSKVNEASAVPLAFCQFEGNGCGLLERLEEDGTLLSLFVDEMGDGEDIGKGTQKQPELKEADEHTANTVDAAKSNPIHQFGQQGGYKSEDNRHS